MPATSTLSIRVPLATRRWLERFAKRRGSAGMAATRILEEAKLVIAESDSDWTNRVVFMSRPPAP
jgi:hypothetical protein